MSKMLKTISLTPIVVLLTGVLWLSSCTKNDTGTIVAMGAEYYIDDILDVVSDSAFWADFGDVNRGGVPPKIEGKYLVSPKLRIATNLAGVPINIVEPDAKVGFTQQHNGIVVMDLEDNSTETMTDTVFVMGSGNDFTAYVIEEKTYEVPVGNVSYRVRLKRGIVMTGTMVDEGIARFRLATIIMEAEDDSHGVLVQNPPGAYHIYKDNDELAQRIE